MKDRLFSTLGALAALITCVALLAPQPDTSAPVSRPISTDRGGHGLYGLFEWVKHSDVPVRVLKRRYSNLWYLAPGDGNVLVITLPQRTPSRDDELEDLSAWIAAGNTALVMIGEVTAPPWTLANVAAGDDGSELSETLGFHTVHAAKNKKAKARPLKRLNQALQTPAESTLLRPRGVHPLLAGVRQVRSDGNALGDITFAIEPEKKMRAWPALLKSENPRPQDLWLGRLGAGRVLVLADPAIFGNRHLGVLDNARLFNNVLAFARGEQGRVVFDDMHQGVSELYDPQAFARDPRVYGSLAFLLVLWLAWVIGHSNRFGPVHADRDGEASESYAAAVGGLLARQAAPRDIASALITTFARDCRRRHPGLFEHGLDSARLAHLPGMSAAALAGLSAAQQALAAGRCPDLIKLTNHLRTLRMRL